MIFEPLVFFVLLGLVMTPPRVMSSEVIFSRSGQITSFKLAGKTCISGATFKKGVSKHYICKSEYWQDRYDTPRAKSKVNIVFKTYLSRTQSRAFLRSVGFSISCCRSLLHIYTGRLVLFYWLPCHPQHPLLENWSCCIQWPCCWTRPSLWRLIGR